PSVPIGVPDSSPRSVSVIGVNGWCSANQRRPAGIESVGTNPLPRNGSSNRNIGVLLAVSTLLLASPSATHSQASANATSTANPATASHSTAEASGRKPSASSTASTNTTA